MKLHSKFGVKALFILGATFLFSFSTKKGGDSFEIWINGKKAIQQFVHVSKGVQTLHFTAVSENDKVDVYYSHCGQTGKDRYLTVKDEKNRPLKVWKFGDSNGNNTAMSLKLKDITRLKKQKSDKLGLFYSSQQLPDGRLLAMIDSGNDSGIASR